MVLKRGFNHILCINPVVRIALKVLFVETHGGDNGACGPVDHDICQEVIQAEFPVEETCRVNNCLIFMLKIIRRQN